MLEELQRNYAGTAIAVNGSGVENVPRVSSNTMYPLLVQNFQGVGIDDYTVTGSLVLRSLRDTPRVVKVRVASEYIELLPSWNTGALNHTTGVVLVSRSPFRQWRRGIRHDTLELEYSNPPALARARGVHDVHQLPIQDNLYTIGPAYYYLLMEMLNPSYSSYLDAVGEVRSGVYLGRAINNSIHIQALTGYRVPCLMYRGTIIGYVADDNTPMLLHSHQQWKEFIEECAGLKAVLYTQTKEVAM